jgi:hypothetical protein
MKYADLQTTCKHLYESYKGDPEHLYLGTDSYNELNDDPESLKFDGGSFINETTGTYIEIHDTGSYRPMDWFGPTTLTIHNPHANSCLDPPAVFWAEPLRYNRGEHPWRTA